MCARVHIFDRAVADVVLRNYGIIDQQVTVSLTGRSKLRLERFKFKEKIREEENELLSNVDGLYID